MKAKHGAGDFSAEVLAAFRKRSKAMKHKVAVLQATPIKKIVDGRVSSIGRGAVELTYRIEGARTMLCIHAWGDRWVWVDARRWSKAGWVWEFTREGRYVSQDGARTLVELAEKSIAASYGSAAVVTRELAEIWSKVLATGPHLVATGCSRETTKNSAIQIG